MILQPAADNNNYVDKHIRYRRTRFFIEMGVALAISAMFVLFLGGLRIPASIPIFYLTYRKGPRIALFTSFVLGLLLLAVRPYWLHPIVIIESPLEYMCIALAGFFPMIGPRSSLFEMDDITDWKKFTDKLIKDNTPAVARIREFLGEKIDAIVSRINSGDEAARVEMIDSLNILLERRDLYDEKSFENISNNKKAKRYLKKGVKYLRREDLQSFNRLILESAFPGFISTAGRNFILRWLYNCRGIVLAATLRFGVTFVGSFIIYATYLRSTSPLIWAIALLDEGPIFVPYLIFTMVLIPYLVRYRYDVKELK